MPIFRSLRGFTLIELMVVITIIAILATIAFSTFKGATNSGKDARRKADINSLAEAYELNFNSSSKTYSAVSSTDFGSKTLPKDPAGGNYSYVVGPGAVDIPPAPTPTVTINASTASTKSFQICATLSDGTTYCKSSTRNQLALTSTPALPTSGPTATPTIGPSPTPTSVPVNGFPLSGLAAYWRLDESSGVSISDQLGFNPGIVDAGINPVVGKINNGRLFDGVGKATISKSASLTFSNGLSVSAWIKPLNCAHGGSGHNTVLAQENGFLLAFTNSCQVNNYISTLGTWRNDAPVVYIPINSWSMYSITWDGSTLRSYLNGNLITGSGGSAPGAYSNPSYNIYIGARPDCCLQTFNGTIDEVGIWNRPLSAAEISGLYNGGLGRQY